MSNFVNAAELASVMNAYTCADSVVLFVKNQGNEYKKLFRNKGLEGQLNIFDYM